MKKLISPNLEKEAESRSVCNWCNDDIEMGLDSSCIPRGKILDHLHKTVSINLCTSGPIHGAVYMNELHDNSPGQKHRHVSRPLRWTVVGNGFVWNTYVYRRE